MFGGLMKALMGRRMRGPVSAPMPSMLGPGAGMFSNGVPKISPEEALQKQQPVEAPAESAPMGSAGTMIGGMMGAVRPMPGRLEPWKRNTGIAGGAGWTGSIQDLIAAKSGGRTGILKPQVMPRGEAPWLAQIPDNTTAD
jgi:hypothetical protein